MIKFFRKIRYNLMEQNKTGSPAETSVKAGKYLKYAIGEIVLVVFGILIALQINNWNQGRNRTELGTLLLKQLKVEMLQIYSDIYTDFNFLKLGSRSHFNILEYIEQDVIYNDSMSFDFFFIIGDEYIYPNEAVYSRIKEQGLDIIKNDSIRNLIQTIYEDIFPRISKNNSFNPDIAETFGDYYLDHFKLNTDYSIRFHHVFDNDTLSDRIYRDEIEFPYERVLNGKKRNQTKGFVPLDFEALKKDNKFRMLLERTKDYRTYKGIRYGMAINRIQKVITLIDIELKSEQ
ncbi:hypothetical protein OE09_0881 [Flavobacteriaceae bacterium MAR_2010_72]|nr:hypothetical protein OE09_0881 [Flavobacteriaceae bacterium MAR_2010_72]TVZ60312.1 hypothetical protein NA63_2864 [Flavobacteriaceae bacterium MAR_2010_105]